MSRRLASIYCLIVFISALCAALYFIRMPSESAGAKNTARNCPPGVLMKSCNETYFETLAKNAGVSSALSELTADILTDTHLASTCHSAAHRIGHVAALHYGSLGNAFDGGSDVCGNGFYHGVIEQLFGEREFSLLTADDIREICSNKELATTSPLAHMNCVHGIGHALMYMSDGNISRSLLYCGKHSSDSDISQCATGVLMEEGFRTLHSTSTDNTRSDPTLVCSQALGDQTDCWLSQSVKEIVSVTGNTTQAKIFCQALKTPRHLTDCFSQITK